MADDGNNEWDARVRGILLPGEELEEEKEPEPPRPVVRAKAPPPIPEVDWSVEPTQEQQLEAAMALESAGIPIPMETKARMLGFRLTAPPKEDDPRLVITKVTGTYSVDPSFWGDKKK